MDQQEKVTKKAKIRKRYNQEIAIIVGVFFASLPCMFKHILPKNVTNSGRHILKDNQNMLNVKSVRFKYFIQNIGNLNNIETQKDFNIYMHSKDTITSNMTNRLL